MGKGWILEPRHKTLIAARACLLLAAVTLASCSLPSIHILRDPLTPEEHVMLGMSYEKQGELRAALEQYGYAKDKDPTAHLYMGNVYFQMKDYERAEEEYNKAVALTGEPTAMNNLAWLYYEQGIKLREAESLSERAVSLAPESEEFRDTLARIRRRIAGTDGKE